MIFVKFCAGSGKYFSIFHSLLAKKIFMRFNGVEEYRFSDQPTLGENKMSINTDRFLSAIGT